MEFKEFSSHIHEQNVSQRDLAGKFHFSGILPKAKPLQNPQSCKPEYQNILPIRCHLVVLSLELPIAFLHSFHFSLVHSAPPHPQYFLHACVFHIPFGLGAS